MATKYAWGGTKFNFTDKAIAALHVPPQGTIAIHRDSVRPGLALRVMPSGHRQFLHCYYFDGKERRISIQPWVKGNNASIAKARRRVTELHGDVSKGVDPYDERLKARKARQRAREQAAKESTVAQLVERFINEHVSKKCGARPDQRRLNNLVIPAWGTRKAKDITRADVDAFVSPIANGPEAKPYEANHRLALVRKMFSFALDKSIIDVHPCLRMHAPGGPTKARDRVLDNARELRIFWRITDGGRWSRYLPEIEADALRFMVLTACRPREAAQLPWSEIDMEQGLWTKPRASGTTPKLHRTKNGREHLLPLPEPAMEILRKRAALGGAYVFPAPRGPCLTVDRLDRLLKKACKRLERIGVQPFTPHDFRRTVETGMAAAKVPKEYRDRVLNHRDASVGGVHYNKYDYMDEKRDALRAWTQRLEGLLRGNRDNVVPLRRKGV